MLIVALAFGQVGVSFLHNKHDAHETVVDLDHTVLVKHGEHCKVCAVDWIHVFLGEDLQFDFLREEYISVSQASFPMPASAASIINKDRAPPAFA